MLRVLSASGDWLKSEHSKKELVKTNSIIKIINKEFGDLSEVYKKRIQNELSE